MSNILVNTFRALDSRRLWREPFRLKLTNEQQVLKPKGAKACATDFSSLSPSSWRFRPSANIKEHAGDGERSLYVKDLVLAHRRLWGWRFVDEFCWRKTDNGVPGGWGNRFKNAWEPVFHFCRQPEIKFRPTAVGHVSEDCFDYSPSNPKSTSGERSARHRSARRRGGPAWRRRQRWPVHRHRAPEQRDRAQDGEQPRIALGSVSAGVGRVFRKGVLRCRRHRVRSLPRKREHDGRGACAGA